MNLLQSPGIEIKVTSMTCFLVVLAFDMIVEQIIMKLIYLRFDFNNQFILTTTTTEYFLFINFVIIYIETVLLILFLF